jgi:hypothetical protein
MAPFTLWIPRGTLYEGPDFSRLKIHDVSRPFRVLCHLEILRWNDSIDLLSSALLFIHLRREKPTTLPSFTQPNNNGISQ